MRKLSLREYLLTNYSQSSDDLLLVTANMLLETKLDPHFSLYTAGDLAVGRLLYIKDKYPNLTPYSIIWDVATMFVGVACPRTALKAPYIEAFNILASFLDFKTLSVQDLIPILASEVTLLENTEYLDQVPYLNTDTLYKYLRDNLSYGR